MKYNFKCPIFGVNVVVNFDNEPNSGYVATTYVKETLELNDEDKKKISFEIRIREDHRDNWLILVHECLHLTRRIFQYTGVPFNTSNHELIAYYQGYWIKTIQEGIK